MSLFGMLNWNFLWFREDGALSREDYAELVVAILLDGAAPGFGANRRADKPLRHPPSLHSRQVG
jgi:hypothetical protein